MPAQYSPRNIVISMSALLVLVTAIAIWLAIDHPWLGVELEPSDGGVKIIKVYENGPADIAGLKQGQVIKGLSLFETGAGKLPDGTMVELVAGDLIIEPDDHALVKNYLSFFDKQSQIYKLIQHKTLSVITADGQYVLTPDSIKPISRLSFYFWFQLFCAYSIVVMGALVWAYSQREISSRLYALATLGLLIAIVPSAIYTTRELAFNGEFFHMLSMTNQLGVMLFCGPGTALFWFYPKPISRFPILYFLAFLVVVFLGLNYLHVYESLDYAVRLPVVFWVLLDISLGVVQWQRSKTDPVSRAQLKWFIVAWISGPIAYVTLNVIPLLIGVEPFVTQKTGWVLFVLVYLGMALGLRRYRLFNLDRWILNAWFWLLCGAGVILFDVLLFASLGLDHDESVVISLALVGWVYFPLRQLVFDRVARKKMKYNSQQLLPELLNVLLVRSQIESPKVLWLNLLEQMYKPLHIDVVEGGSNAEAKIENDGQSLLVPGFPGEGSLRMHNANKGDRLFNPDDVCMINAISLLYRHILDFQDAHLQGAKTERKRLARDLHDDVSSKVLSLIYRSESEDNAQLGRETLEELRNVINDLESGELSLEVNLFDWQCEIRQRCEESGLQLSWKQSNINKETKISSSEKSNLRRILRESISNIIKHAQATKVDIEIANANGHLEFKIEDNGKGFDISSVKKGHGLLNMQRRAKEMGALLDIGPNGNLGSVINMYMPLLIDDAGMKI